MRPRSCETASPPAGSTEGAELLYPPRDLWLTQLHPSSAQAVCPGSRAPCWEPKTLPGVSGTEGQECFALLQSRRRGCSQLLAPWYRGSLTSPAPPLTRPVAPATPPVPPGFVFARICAVARAARCAGVWWRRGRSSPRQNGKERGAFNALQLLRTCHTPFKSRLRLYARRTGVCGDWAPGEGGRSVAGWLLPAEPCRCSRVLGVHH